MAVGVGHLPCLPHEIFKILTKLWLGSIYRGLSRGKFFFDKPARTWTKRGFPQPRDIQSLHQGAVCARSVSLEQSNVLFSEF